MQYFSDLPPTLDNLFKVLNYLGFFLSSFSPKLDNHLQASQEDLESHWKYIPATMIESDWKQAEPQAMEQKHSLHQSVVTKHSTSFQHIFHMSSSP